MEVLHEKCAGLDVHKDSVVVCARVVVDGVLTQEVMSFGTTTQALLALSDWLESHGCTHVAMESTGVYWKPVWHILEPSFTLVLGNAAHIRNVPGRKTDVNDAMWIADLLAHGLIRGSFVPPGPIQELRALTRTRKQLVRERAQHVLRIQKTLEDANIKIASVITDILGKSGRAILAALIAGETEPSKLLEKTSLNLKASRASLLEAVRGSATANHRFLLELHLGQVDSLETAISKVDRELAVALKPHREKLKLLVTIPGVGDVVAEVILSEIGIDMTRFPDAEHLVSWAGLCPRNHVSAGKRSSTRIREGAPWLKDVLVQAAWAAVRTKGTYLRALFHRLKARRGSKKAIIAVAASMLTAVYHMLRNGQEYKDLGPQHFDSLDKSKTVRRLTSRLQSLGYQVELREAS
jgi:transposase